MSQPTKQFASMFTHELRTRMNVVMGMTELSLETNLTAEQRDMILAIQESSAILYYMMETVIEVLAARDRDLPRTDQLVGRTLDS